MAESDAVQILPGEAGFLLCHLSNGLIEPDFADAAVLTLLGPRLPALVLGRASLASRKLRRASELLAAARGRELGVWPKPGESPLRLLPGLHILAHRAAAGRLGLGARHTALALAEGGLASWGEGEWGQLGQGGRRDSHLPRPVPLLADSRVRWVDCGQSHSLVVTMGGQLLSWGEGGEGQLGHGGFEGEDQPRAVTGLPPCRAVAAGSYHSLALTVTGELLSWGSGTAGQLGTGQLQCLCRPQLIQRLAHVRVVAIDAGARHSVALNDRGGRRFCASGGDLFSWGAGGYGQLGHDRAFTMIPEWVESLAAEPVVSVSAGLLHTAAVTETGKLFSWGNGQIGQLGHGPECDDGCCEVPRLVQALGACTVVQVACGGYHTVAVSDEGRVFCWGQGLNGRLGQGDHQDHDEPQPVYGLPSSGLVLAVAAGDSHSAALTTTRQVYTWGSGFSGRLGHGQTAHEYHPRAIPAIHNSGYLN